MKQFLRWWHEKKSYEKRTLAENVNVRFYICFLDNVKCRHYTDDR